MQISLLTVVTFMNVLVSAESTFMRGGSTNSDKDTNSNHRSLALSECSDSGEVLYKDKTCDWISAINNKKKMKTECNKKTKLGRIYDLCPSTCSGVDLGPCTTSKLGETINALRAAITDFETPITDEDEDNDKDEEFEKLDEDIDSLRETCNELSVLKMNACKDVPVDCDNGFERGTDVTCERACDGDCCVHTSTKNNELGYARPCTGFTGLIHRDGSCISELACQYATIGEVQGPSCTGRDACSHSTSTQVTDSCNGYLACGRIEVDLIEGSCNGNLVFPNPNDCHGIHATSIVNGEVLGEFDPREICRDECRSSEEEGGSEAYYDCLRECDYMDCSGIRGCMIRPDA